MIKLSSKTKLFVYVGGQGVAEESKGKVEGGFNGGGYSADPETRLYKKGVGGGGTDIRIGTDSLFSRVIVAGGGITGCAGSQHEKGVANASPGTQICGGEPGESSGRKKALTKSGISIATGIFGIGGSVTDETSNTRAGTGGGWYGGGAGNLHGGAGSGWVFTEENFHNWMSGNSIDASKYLLKSTYYLSDAKTLSGDNEFQSPSGLGRETCHCGNGFVKITIL